jgi:hypothetical protein
MSTTVELRTGKLFFKLFPAIKLPSEDPKLLDIVTQIWHVLGGKGLIYEDDNDNDNVKIMGRRKNPLRTISDRNWFIDIHWGCTVDLLFQRLHVAL